MTVLTRKDLDNKVCAASGCTDDVLYFHGRCHPNSRTWAFYDKSIGVLTIECATCKRVIAKLEIASGE